MDSITGVFFFNEDLDFSYSFEKPISEVLKKVIEDHNSELGSISVIFCSDEYLLNLNKEYLDHNYYTDIITFPMENKPLSGDLFISIDRVKDNANQRSAAFESELNRVIIHGVLHLVGYGDKTDEEIKEMRGQENHYLNSFASL